MNQTTYTEKSDQLLWLGLYDNLTRLPNRYLFLDRLNHIKRHAAREKFEFAVLMIDISNLLAINLEHGHSAGDQVLMAFTDRLLAQARDSDTIARFGGNTFAVLLGYINPDSDIDTLADKYTSVINEKITFNDIDIETETAIGIAYYPKHSEDMNDLLHKAEKAMVASSESKRAYSVYSELYRDSIAENLYNYDIDQLFKDEDIRFQYQPVCELVSGKIISAEALCRWDHPTMGEIIPANLIVDAINSPIIKSFVSNSLLSILQQSREWQDKGLILPLHFNLSAYMLNDPTTVDLIIDSLDETDVSPQHLILELTETEFYNMDEVTIGVIQQLADKGIQIALDDFGVGFSSMAHLLKFPVNMLKIDRTFVADIHRNNKARIITESLITMAHQLDAKVVAEGVAAESALQLLKNLGCDLVQSHQYHPPLSAEQISQLFKG